MTPTELWLPLGAIAFHLYDATQALWQNELLFVRAGDHWTLRAESPLRRWGRRMVLPGLFTPQRPVFRMAWRIDDARPAAAADLAPLLRALRPIGFLCQLLLLLLLSLWPVCWLLGAGLTVLAVFVAYYLLVVVALVLVFRRRRAFSLAPRQFWGLAFDVLACAPFAVNLVRRLSLHHGLPGDPVAFAARHFDAPARQQLASLIRGRLAESRQGEPASPEEEARIAQWLARLETAGP